MPHAAAKDGTRLYYEEAGRGVPILFVHEFAADYASWEPQMRHFSRQYRCICYSARGYTPSDVPNAGAYSWTNFRDDAVAVLDHLKIEKAHLVGLSMGAYSSLQVALAYPSRVLSMTLAGIGSGSEPWYTTTFRQQAQTHGEKFETLGAREYAKSYGTTANRITFMHKDPRGFAEFQEALARHDSKGSALTQREFQGGRPSIWDSEKALEKVTIPTLIVCGDEDDGCIEPSLFLKQHMPTAGLSMFPKTGHVLNLEEPALFNEALASFLAQAEAGRWPARDPRSIRSQRAPTR
jgi:proline iminopeptidase